MAAWFPKSRKITNSLETKCRIFRFLLGRTQLPSGSSMHSNSSCLQATRTLTDRNPQSQPPFSRNSAALFVSRRFESIKAEKQSLYEEDGEDDEENQALAFPGGTVTFTSQMNFISDAPHKQIPCYRVLDDDGYPITGSRFEQVSKELAVKIYIEMVTLQIMDTIFYEAQRQGRISFYLTSAGEEAVNIASAAALSEDDIVLPQYREPGVLLWRGFTLQEFANQLFGNKADYGKGRQMPIHYGSNMHNYITISSPIATQIPQAAGVAYSLKLDKKKACAVTYIGDGATSENAMYSVLPFRLSFPEAVFGNTDALVRKRKSTMGDFHAGLNFAAVMEVPVVFFCRNNGWAISTPITEQFRCDGIAVKGQAYGIRSIRVDGNDALAVFSSMRMARGMAIEEQRPILIEALTYRVGHHSTSDDSTKYRPINEIEHWRTARNPIARFRKWVQRNGWWSDEDESELLGNIRNQVLHAVQKAEKVEKPPLAELFSDVYAEQPTNLAEQERLLREAIKRHPQDYPSDVPV